MSRTSPSCLMRSAFVSFCTGVDTDVQQYKINMEVYHRNGVVARYIA
jgi:hypothetical protein